MHYKSSCVGKTIKYNVNNITLNGRATFNI